jgi:1-aminocyclopropane-1-carboxylate deaminase/D-cysteine desulfhydrase-like pyridoxal-dependent ACC family enzyme
MDEKMNIENSLTQSINFKGHNFYIKRDDLLDDDFSGNKARKFYYFLKHDFPNIDTVVSYGSNQSNAMYSLSVLAKLKGWKFIYYIDHIPSYLEENPNGNYKYALANGMELKIGNWEDEIKSENKLFISEGGAINEAKYGLEILACEIQRWKTNNSIKKLKIFLPSGTGTTALFLQNYLDDEVLTTPCVGDSDYLKQQFLELIDDEMTHPTILKGQKKYHFGKLYKENYELYKELYEQTTIEFDLLYDPIGWRVLLDNIDKYQGYEILYIHQGGLKGNETMLQRYERKYLKN